MTREDLALMLALLGGVCLLAAWLGRRSGDLPRDTVLIASIGACKLAGALVLGLA